MVKRIFFISNFKKTLNGMRCNALRAGWLQLQAQAAPCF
jgi:hypothetical protein